MNIFFLHLDPAICAMMHVDKHVVKMILETCQMLCTTHHLVKSNYKPPYKIAHKNHPSTIWVRTSIHNYKWLLRLGIELCKEYTYRYGKTHKSETYIREMMKDENMPELPDIEFTEPSQAMPDMYKCKSSLEAYRAYYFFEKYEMFSWKKRKEPEWIKEMRSLFE